MGEVLRGRYELLEVAGEGAEGTVLRSLDRQHDRIVALKVRAARAERRKELLAEARVLLAVPAHPNLPLVREDFFDGDRYVIAMDWVEGTDLGVLLRTEGRPGLPVPSVLRWLADAAEALTHLHTQSPPVVHGDVKPANLILANDGHLVLVDFGLSSSPATPGRRGGTLGYVAPELAAGADPSRASDVYALAATAWALLTGMPPMGIRPGWEGLAPSDAAQLEHAIRAGLATDPARRPSTPGELVERIRAGWSSDLPTGVLTFCLTDVEGSTSRWEADPDAMARALVRHDDVVAAAVQDHGGKMLKSMGEGDATVSVFTSATAAVEASASIQGALAMEEWPGGTPLRVRIGLHTGEAEHRGDDYFGVALSVAARVRSLASGGEVFLSGVTAALVSTSLPEGWGLVELGPHRLDGIEAPVPVHALAAAGVAAPPAVTESPYRGLLPFQSEDRDRFFGREDTVTRLAEILARRGFVAVVGSSGSGKSSVLRAGVAPLFRGARVVTPATSAPDDLGGEELLVVDQFEELFTAVAEPDRAAVIDAVLGRPGPVAIAVRADFYGHCGSHSGLAEAVASSQVLLGPMAEADLRRAISAPAAAAGLTLAPGLVDRVVHDVAGEPGALPLLSHALLATWQRRDGRTLTLEGYLATGGVRGAIAASADRLVSGLDATDRDLTRSVLLRLVEPGDGTADTRRRAPVDELRPRGVDPARFARVLAELAEARLVTMGVETVEISHEALLREWPQLQAWLDEDRDGLRTMTRLRAVALEWDRSGRDPGDLLRGARLAATLDWASATPMPIGAVEEDFLEACRQRENADLRIAERRAADERRARRRVTRLLVGVALLLVLAIVGGALALVQRSRADDQSERADAEARARDVQRLGAVAQVQDDLDLSLLLAAQAAATAPDPTTEAFLFDALLRSPRATGVYRSDGPRLLALALDPGGTTIALNENEGGVTLVDAGTMRRLRHRDGPNGLRALAWNRAGDRLATLGALEETGDGVRAEVHLLDRDLQVRSVLTGLDDMPASFVFSDDGRWLASVTFGDVVPSRTAVALWDTDRPGPPVATLEVPDGWRSDDAQLWFQADDAQLVIPRADGLLVLTVPSLATETTVAGPVHASPSVDRSMIAFAPASNNAVTVLRDVATGQDLPLLVGHSARILGRAFSPDGRLLATVSDDRTVKIWSTEDGTLWADLQGHAGRVLGVQFDPDGRTLYTSGLDGTVIAWDVAGDRGAVRRLDHPRQGTVPQTQERVLTPGGRFSIAATEGGPIDVVDLTDLDAPRRSIDVGHGTTDAMVPTSDGRSVLTGGADGVMRRTSLTTGRAEGVVPGPNGSFRAALAVSGDGREALVQVGTDGVEIRDARTLEEIRPTVRLGASIGIGAFDPTGRHVAVTSENPSTLRILDVDDLSVVATTEGSLARTLLWSADGTTLFAGGEDGTVHRYDATSLTPLGPPINAHDGLVLTIDADPSGTTLVTAGTDGTVVVWERATGHRRLVIDAGRPNQAAGAQFLADGTLRVVYNSGETYDVDLRPKTWLDQACRVAARSLTEQERAEFLTDPSAPSACADGAAAISMGG